MHVCLTFAGTESGGMERHVSDLAHGLADKHHRVSLVAHQIHAANFDERIDFFATRLDRWRFNPLMIFQVVRRIRSLQPDVVHAHGRKAAAIMASARRLLDVPMVLSLHNPGKASKVARHFDHVIGVSSIVTGNLDHPRKTTVLNGRG